MMFPDFPFDTDLPSFISHWDVQTYLERYCTSHAITPHIKVQTHLISAFLFSSGLFFYLTLYSYSEQNFQAKWCTIAFNPLLTSLGANWNPYHRNRSEKLSQSDVAGGQRGVVCKRPLALVRSVCVGGWSNARDGPLFSPEQFSTVVEEVKPISMETEKGGAMKWKVISRGTHEGQNIQMFDSVFICVG